MKAFLTGPKRKSNPTSTPVLASDDAEESTEVKLAMLSSLHPTLDQETLVDVLLAHDGSVAEASASLQNFRPGTKKSGVVGHQQSLRHFAVGGDPSSPPKKRMKSKKGSTLHLFDPADVAEHTPCTIIHNFLPPDLANDLLQELLDESDTFERITFKLFDNVVSSPHTSSFYVETSDEIKTQKTDYYYNGSKLTDIRKLTPQLAKVRPLVQDAVNDEVDNRIKTRYPGGKKLKYQSAKRWSPNSAFVNCYDGAQQSVGWHSDQLTYLGPRAIIGSISLGVAREFRVRRVLPKDEDTRKPEDSDAEGQIAIHLPHNSLLVMHAEMQEEWKHSISPAQSIDPHPIAGNKRINITYRDYRARMHPNLTPKCRCNVPCVLRVVQRKRENFGKYFWMCHAGNVPDKEGCTYFAWAEFDDDGNPLFKNKQPTALDLEPRLPPKLTARTPGTIPDDIFVTLTFATSLDSALSLAPGVRTRLSGPGSKAMTHFLRSRHDAILVGVSTVLADNPGLNCRIDGSESQPRPIIVDPHLRWEPRDTDKVLEICRAGEGLAPYVITASELGQIPAARRAVLERHGGKYITVRSNIDKVSGRQRFDWGDVFDVLRQEQLSSVMVEGGGQIINSLLDPAFHSLIKSVIVTIAPTWLGRGGVVVSPNRVTDTEGTPVVAARLTEVSWHPFGEDVVLCGRLPRA